MRKPFKHTELSDVRCAHEKCAMVNGKEGVIRRLIKKNVVERFGGTKTKLYCYPCSVFLKNGMTSKEHKVSRRRKKVNHQEERIKQMQMGEV
jgi:hypothetical protein